MTGSGPPRWRWVHRRWVHMVGYLLMAAAGVCAVIWPTRSVEEATNRLDALILLWAGFLLVGGLLSAYGALTDRWFGEYTGLPLLAVVFVVYGIGALTLGPSSGWTSVAGGMVFLGVSCLLLGRWRETFLLRRAAAAQARAARREGAGGG